MRVGVIFVAGGKSKRMQGKDKLLIKIGGEFALMRGLMVFENSPLIDEIVFSTSMALKRLITPLLKHFRTEINIDISEEGRAKAVYHALERFANKPDIVLVHDGARPFVSKELVQAVIMAVLKYDAVVPGIKSDSHILEIDENAYAIKFYNRENITFVQTPQGFKFNLIRNAYKSAFEKGVLDTFTDSASVLERYGGKITVISGEKNNFKLTTPADIKRAEEYLQRYGAKNLTS